MGLLTDKDVAYNGKLVRANAVKTGDTISFEDEIGLVVEVDKFILELAEDDAETRALLDEIKEHGAADKVSPNFDETVKLVIVVADYDQDGRTHLQKFTKYLPEWALVRTYV